MGFFKFWIDKGTVTVYKFLKGAAAILKTLF